MGQHPANYFSEIDNTLAGQLAEKFGTPVFIMDKRGLLQRYYDLHAAVTQRYKHSMIAVSYKTNFLKGILALLHGVGAHAEVVSGVEYAVAKEIRLPHQRIVFNGPMKTRSELLMAINDNALINCDHEDEIDLIEQIAKDQRKVVPIGLRIYFREAQSSWSRFGFQVDSALSDTATEALIRRIRVSPNLHLAGLHAHIGTNIRDVQHFSRLGKYLSSFASLLKARFNIELDWIDVGGGLAGISPRKDENREVPYELPDAHEYADAIITPLLGYINSLTKPPLLIFEPGRTLFEASGGLLTRVIGRRSVTAGKSQALILDAGMNALSTCYLYDFPIRNFADNSDYVLTRLLGPTCNQADQLHTPIVMPSLNIDDLLLFYGVG